MHKNRSLLLVLALVLVLGTMVTTGCKKKMQPPPPAPAPVEQPPEMPKEEVKPPPPMEAPKPEPPVKTESLDDLKMRQNSKRDLLRTVYFDFDKYDLRPDTIATLKTNADWLKAHPQVRIVIEGHCDERGTIEYNLELGDKRARAVMDYLGSLGVPAGTMRKVSYGEERPVDPGHDERAWALNRRAEFTIE